MISSGAAIHGRQPVGQRAADGEADESRRAAARFRVFRRAGPQVPQAEHGQARSWWRRGSAAAAPRDWARCASAPPPWRRVTSGSARTPDADEGAQQRVDPGADRPGGVEPRAGGDHDGKAEQTPARCRRGGGPGRCRGPGPPTGPRRPRPCRHQPGRAQGAVRRSARRPPAANGAPFGGLARPLAGCCRPRATASPLREAAFDLLVRAPERAAVLLAMSARLVASPPSAPSATLVTARACEPSDGLVAASRE